MRRCNELEVDPESMLEFKRDAFWFDELFSLAKGLTDPQENAIHARLSHVLRLIRNVHAIDAVPNYAEIQSHVDAVIGLLEQAER